MATLDMDDDEMGQGMSKIQLSGAALRMAHRGLTCAKPAVLQGCRKLPRRRKRRRFCFLLCNDLQDLP